ncbi:hypothetical protein AVEN_2001-1 [Araneus ventricosus]|uniref:Phosphatidylinositol-4,5-bisphosphate 4-phosphatase n=2 Tax=Araneus ventricosus TaxID=182803 RepID=A0A4Y2LB96_ARAVE|nr:hypothetical protein AVEN_2001-1 [Araneus ventricosus]
MCQVSCAYCHSLFLFNTLTNALARCPHCRKVSSVGQRFSVSRGTMYMIAAFVMLIIGIGVTVGTYSYAAEHGGIYCVYVETKAGQEEMRVAQAGLEQRIEAGQEDIRSGQEWMEKGQEEMKGMIDKVKASLRGSAAEVLQEIPADKLTDLTTIEKALESRFGDSHMMQFYRTELKTKKQKPGEILPSSMGRRCKTINELEYPLDIQESLAVQFFVDAIRDDKTQLSTRSMDFTDLKSALAYSMKFESSKTASKISIHARSVETKDDTWKERDDKF